MRAAGLATTLAAATASLAPAARGATAAEATTAAVLEAQRSCDPRSLRLALWSLDRQQAAELLEALPAADAADQGCLQAAVLARVGGREAAALGLAVLDEHCGAGSASAAPAGERLLLEADLELARSASGRALELYLQAERQLDPAAAPELHYHLARRVAELYLSSTPLVERALPYLRKAIGLAYQLGRQAEIERLQELQQLFAVQYYRMRERADALHFEPVAGYSGLVGAEVRALVPAPDGLWLLGNAGAAFLDAGLWWAYPSEMPFGWTALRGSDAALYAAPVNGGLARLAAGRWEVLEQPEGFETNAVFSMLERDGQILLARGQSLARLRLGQTAIESLPLVPESRIQQVAELGEQLVVTTERALHVERDGRWQRLELPAGIPPDATLAEPLVQGRELWLPTSQGIYRWQPQGVQHYTVADGLPANPVAKMLAPAATGVVFAASPNTGMLARFDGEAWRSSSEPISALDLEQLGEHLLVATPEGLVRGPSSRWRLLDSQSGLLGDQIEYVLRLGDETWLLAQTQGVMRLQEAGIEFFGAADGLQPLTVFLSMARQDERRWLGTNTGLYVLEGDHFRPASLRSPLPSPQVLALHAAGPDELLVGTTDGLVLLRADGTLEPVDLPAPVVRVLGAFGQDGVLVGTEGAGLVALQREPATGRYRVARLWNQHSGLCSDQIQALHVAGPEELWVGTNAGLARRTLGKDGTERWQCWTKADGLPGNDVTAIAAWSDGRLAVGFYGVGVGLFDGETWSAFGTRDGLPSTSIWSVLEREPGLLWAGTSRGLWELRLEAPAPETYLELAGLLYRPAADGTPCVLGSRIEAQAEAAPPVRLRLGLRDYAALARTPAEACQAERATAVPRLDALPEPLALGQTAWELEDPQSLWYSVQIDDAPPGPFLSGSALALPQLGDGRHRLGVRAKNRFLQVDPSPVFVTFVLDRPTPLWVLGCLAGTLLLLLYLFRSPLRSGLARLRHLRFRPIPLNPYTPKAPATGVLLAGRDALLERWLAPARRPDALAESRLVLGPLSLGKTSVLREFQRRAADAGHRASLLDLSDWMQDSFDALVRALCERLREASPPLPAVAASGDSVPGSGSSPLRSLDQDLEQLGRLQPPQRVFVLLDNFQLFDPLLARTETPAHDVLLAMRSLLQRHRHLSLILGLNGDEALLKSRYAELFFFSSVDPLAPLSAERTAELCRQPLAGYLYVTPAAIGLVHRLTGGHPALLQIVLHALVERLSAARTNICEATSVRAAVPSLLDEARLLHGWWQSRTRPEQLVLALLAERLGESQVATVGEFAQAEADRLGLLPQEVRRALVSCREALLLRGDELQLGWSSELFHLWVRSRQPFQSVLARERIQLGPYELLSKVGQGGMGSVYRARHLTGGGIVAVKVLHAGALDDAESRQRFFREAEIGVRLRHNNIVRIHEQGEHGGQAYLAMEFLQGTTLRGHIQDKGPLGALKAVKILRGVADALRDLHELGVIHRDIKTDNVFLCMSEGSKKAVPKLMDFGLARSEQSRVTKSGVIVGTVAYMSPEQATGGRLGPATDLYSLGVVLFEMLTGRMPFSGPNDVAILSQVVHRAPPDIQKLRPDIPPGLASLLEALLAKAPEQRPGSAAEVVRQLDALLAAASAQAAPAAGSE